MSKKISNNGFGEVRAIKERWECGRKPGAYFEGRFCPYLLMPSRLSPPRENKFARNFQVVCPSEISWPIFQRLATDSRTIRGRFGTKQTRCRREGKSREGYSPRVFPIIVRNTRSRFHRRGC